MYNKWANVKRIQIHFQINYNPPFIVSLGTGFFFSLLNFVVVGLLWLVATAKLQMKQMKKRLRISCNRSMNRLHDYVSVIIQLITNGSYLLVQCSISYSKLGYVFRFFFSHSIRVYLNDSFRFTGLYYACSMFECPKWRIKRQFSINSVG